MRIAILTLPLHTNIGGILQAWALQTVLEDMGHRVEVLMPRWMKPKIPFDVKVKRAILKIVGGLHEDDFRRINIHIRWIDSLSEDAVKGYDAIVAGSDQVWRKEYFCPNWQTDKAENAFLAFCSSANIRKIIYAASLGLPYWEYDKEETANIREALNHIEAISVREISAVDILRDATGHVPAFVLDPTMLISPERYRTLVKKELAKDPGGVVSYILDSTEDKQKLIEKVTHAKQMPSTELNRHGVTVKQWVASIASADVVVTDSFHGCVFAIIFGRPLIFVINDERGNARFDSLIKTFGIDGNLVTNISEYNSTKDYSLPQSIKINLNQLQRISTSFLNESVSNQLNR